MSDVIPIPTSQAEDIIDSLYERFNPASFQALVLAPHVNGYWYSAKVPRKHDNLESVTSAAIRGCLQALRLAMDEGKLRIFILADSGVVDEYFYKIECEGSDKSSHSDIFGLY